MATSKHYLSCSICNYRFVSVWDSPESELDIKMLAFQLGWSVKSMVLCPKCHKSIMRAYLEGK